MKATATLGLITALGMGGVFLTLPEQEAPPQPIVIQTIEGENVTALEKAREACFDLVLKGYNTSGSAVLVSRIKLEDGRYRYRAMTAHHVVDRMLQGITKGEGKKEVLLTFQPEFHGEQLQIHLDVEDVDWALPAHDWAAFTFISEQRLECVQVATEAEFKQIRAFEHIYIIACSGPYALQCREGNISTTHNVGVWPQEQAKSEYPWHRNPRNFFRLSAPIWYGDSGGAVFNKDGKLIGIINAFTIMGRGWGGGPVTHSGVALKAHIIHDIVKAVPDFLKVED